MSRTVPGYGPSTAKWAIIGEAPGAQEDREGRPFVGQSGQLLRKTLERVGLDPADAYITNVVKERPPGNKTPGVKDINAARPSLVEELQALPNLEAVLLFGNTPLKAISGETGVTKHRGTVKRTYKEAEALDELAFFATLHPAAVLRNQNHFNSWLQDLAAFQQLVSPPNEGGKVFLVDSPEMFQRMLASAGPVGALDIETTIGDVFKGEQTLITLSLTFDGEIAWVLPFEHPQAPPFKVGKWEMQKLRTIFTTTDWIMHNGGFDRMVLEEMGLPITLKHDTMAMAYLLHEEERKSLEVLTSVYLGLPPYKGVDYENIMDEPLLKIAEMNGKDTLRTFQLFRPLADDLNKNKDLSRLYQWLLMPAVNTLIDVTRNGVPIDFANLDDLTVVINQEWEESLRWLIEHTPDPWEDEYPKGWPKKDKVSRFNPGSYLQVGHILYDVFGLPCPKETESGNRSTDDDAITQLQLEELSGEVEEWVGKLRAYRVLSKQLTSYIDAWPKHIAPDGKIHPRYKPLFVVTGRLSSSDPNIQQVPRGKMFRNVFGGVDGWSWMKADYSQIELRLAAWHANEHTMLEAFRTGQDLHALTAKNILGDPSARTVGKILNFGLLYGAGAGTLQRIARTEYDHKLSLNQARTYRARFFETYPALRLWHDRLGQEIQRDGVAVSPLGRVRHLPDAQGWEESLRMRAVREGINHPIQSFASDMLLMALSRVHSQLVAEEAVLVAEVHDEMDLMVRNDCIDKVATIVKATMEDVSWIGKWGIVLDVPIEAEIEVGTHWGTVKEWSPA